MTVVEVRRQRVICEAAGVRDICDVSNGFHTFRQLYYQRMILFATIVKQNRDKAWKSLRHEDGELCFGGGWFIVGIDTPEGSYTYHYENKYFDLFDCEILDYGKQWDGHTEKDVTRLLSLKQESCDYYDTYNETCRRSEVPKEPCDDISRQVRKERTETHENACVCSDVLDKIRAEIFNACSDNYHMPVYKLSCEEIFEIIDKYRAESEDK